MWDQGVGEMAQQLRELTALLEDSPRSLAPTGGWQLLGTPAPGHLALSTGIYLLYIYIYFIFILARGR